MERLERVAVIEATKELVDSACLGAIIIYAKVGQFGLTLLATVATVHYLHIVTVFHMEQPHYYNCYCTYSPHPPYV